MTDVQEPNGEETQAEENEKTKAEEAQARLDEARAKSAQERGEAPVPPLPPTDQTAEPNPDVTPEDNP